jgi:hypothetical protein
MQIRISFLVIGILIFSFKLYSQQIFPKDLKGKWVEVFDTTGSSITFLTDTTVNLKDSKESKVFYFKIDSLNGKQRLLISLLPNDTSRNIKCYIKRIHKDQISLYYINLKINPWENQDKYKARDFLRIEGY